MKYLDFVKVYEELSSTTKKLKKAEILANFFPKLKNHEEWIYLFRGRVFPDYDEREFGISTQLVMKVISKASGVSLDKIILKFRKVGDLGSIVEELIEKREQSTLVSRELTVEKVFGNLQKLVEIQGTGAVEKKLRFVSELLTSASGLEAKYIARTLMNDLKVGVADGIIRDSLAKAFLKDDKESKNKVESAHDKINDWASIMKLSEKGEKALTDVKVVPGNPLKVMLPIKINDISEAFRICGKPLAVEHKYDGFRVVINKDEKGKINLFTRRLDNVTNQFPDIVEIVKKFVKAKSFVLDSEAVGYDLKTGKIKPFEAVSQRIKRKHNVEKLVKELPVELNVFDIMFYNGESTIDLPFSERRKLLEKIIESKKKKIRLSKQFVSSDEKKVLEFYEDALKVGEEGIMLKKLDAPYRPGRRVGYIVKMKPEAKDLDLIITGAEYGTGKRAGGLTSFYVACKKDDKFLEVGKVSSGLKEKESEGTSYKEMDKLLRPLILKEEGNYVKVKPKIIISVTYQNIQPSTKYSSGYALRFPHITHYRPERAQHDITTLKEIIEESK